MIARTPVSAARATMPTGWTALRRTRRASVSGTARPAARTRRAVHRCNGLCARRIGEIGVRLRIAAVGVPLASGPCIRARDVRLGRAALALRVHTDAGIAATIAEPGPPLRVERIHPRPVAAARSRAVVPEVVDLREKPRLR